MNEDAIGTTEYKGWSSQERARLDLGGDCVPETVLGAQQAPSHSPHPRNTGRLSFSAFLAVTLEPYDLFQPQACKWEHSLWAGGLHTLSSIALGHGATVKAT